MNRNDCSEVASGEDPAVCATLKAQPLDELLAAATPASVEQLRAFLRARDVAGLPHNPNDANP